jgi:hypothetical protein
MLRTTRMNHFHLTAVKLTILTILLWRSQLSATPAQDYTVQLDHFANVTLDGSSFSVAIHDDGPKSLRVSFNHAPPILFQKRDGFAQDETETLLYSFGRSRLYYVNVISDRIGFCVLRIRSQ